MRHIGGTGSRHGGTSDQLARVEEILGNLFRAGATHLHGGDCLGIDKEMHIIAWLMGYHMVLHPPTHSNWRAFMNESQYWGRDDVMWRPKPYLVRDQDIVDESSLLLVVPAEATPQPRGGTWATYRMAKKAGVPSRLILPNPVPSTM